MSNITETKSALPAHIAKLFSASKINDALFSGIGSSFPIFSIRGRTWRVVRNGEENVVTLPGTDDPAPSVEVVVLSANPNLSKIFYAAAYVEGSDSKPDCFSNDGVAPDASIEKPQSSKCATCKQNVWGSKITPQGNKTKACSDSRRLAVAPVGDLSDPMLLRVPAASLAELAEYGRTLQRRGVEAYAVVTKLGFDTSAAYPKLTFRPVRFLNEAEAEKVVDAVAAPVVEEIVGKGLPVPVGVVTAAPAPAPEPEIAPAPPEPEGMFDEPAPAPKAAAPKAAAKAKPAAAPAPAPTPIEDLGSQLDDLLKGFDDA
jgi:hypothetical protein